MTMLTKFVSLFSTSGAASLTPNPFFVSGSLITRLQMGSSYTASSQSSSASPSSKLLFRQLFEKDSSTYTYLLADISHPDRPALVPIPSHSFLFFIFLFLLMSFSNLMQLVCNWYFKLGKLISTLKWTNRNRELYIPTNYLISLNQ